MNLLLCWGNNILLLHTFHNDDINFGYIHYRLDYLTEDSHQSSKEITRIGAIQSNPVERLNLAVFDFGAGGGGSK